MSDYPKVLVGTVTYRGKDYIFDEHEQAIQNLQYPNYDRLIVDNTKGNSYVRTLRERGANAVTVSRGDHSYEAITNAYQKIWNRFLDGDYDYLLTVESDLTPYPDAIDRLLLHDRDIVGSWYFLGNKDEMAGLQPCIMLDKPNNGFIGSKLLGRYEKDDGSYGLDVKKLERWKNSGLRRCHGCGFGCTLIHRDIIETFPKLGFVHNPDEGLWRHADTWFYYQLRNNGFSVYVDTDRVVPHYPSDWSKVEDRYGDEIDMED